MHFIKNTAHKGGGICLESTSQIRVQKTGDFYPKKDVNISIYFTSNIADFGEAIYVVDETYFDVCARIPNNGSADCFIQVLSQTAVSTYEPDMTSIKFTTDNYSNCSGSTIVGGLLDRCMPNPYAEILSAGFVNTEINGWIYLKLISNINDTKCISSSPVRLCFCTPDSIPDCSYEPPVIKVKKGESFTVPVVAVDQVNHTMKSVTIYTSLMSTNSALSAGQSTQMTGNACTALNFIVLSPNSSDHLIMYPEGPCRNESMSRSRIFVEFLHCSCPVGFQPIENSVTSPINCKCECQSKLNPYFTDSKCNVQTGVLTREGTSSWINFINDSDLSGYLIYPHCPFDYCLPPYPSVEINLNDVNGADAQCANKRSGILCSVCETQQNLSLSLGNSHCINCSEDLYYIQMVAIIIGALLAGIVLVALMMWLNLTVAVGTLNGLIFYANIVGASSNAFLAGSSSSTKFLIVLTSWINLDINFGLDVCFFQGMDTYWKTWLQLAFPTYVIFLVFVIIIVSKHSMRFSQLILRKNPVATLATLILLSYTMFLRNTISILSIAYIDYPDGSRRRLWLPDATVEYLKGKHIALFIVAILILLASLAYTFLLLFWQWLNYQDRMIFKCIRSQRLYMCHFIDLYHAPYVPKHRYWTGLLLFARIALYLVFALNVSGNPGMNFFVIIVFTACIFFLKGHYGEIYKKRAIDKIEMICYLNLGIFSATRLFLLESDNQKAIDASTYISGTITLVILFAVIIYHAFAELCCKESKKCIWKEKEVMYDESDRAANSEFITSHSSVAPTFSVVEGPRHSHSNDQGHHERFSERSNLLRRTSYDPVLSKQYGSTS